MWEDMEGFECLRVAFCSPSGTSSTHTIYCKTHRVRVNSDLTPNDRTLFTLGWPPYCTKATIKELFSRAGHVTKVFLQASPGAVENSRTTPSLSQGQPPGFQVIMELWHLWEHTCNVGRPYTIPYCSAYPIHILIEIFHFPFNVSKNKGIVSCCKCWLPASGVARGGPSRARPDQLCSSKYLLLVYLNCWSCQPFNSMRIGQK